jgi:hypothetical protein
MPWSRLPDDPVAFPTLGHAAVQWCEDVLLQPDGPAAGEPWRFTDEQYEFVLRLYRLHPVTGRRVYRRGMRCAAVGTGKTPGGCALVWAELAGPVRFAGWDADGQPVAVRVLEAPREHGGARPWIQVAAVSEEQAAQNVWQLLQDMAESDARSLHEEIPDLFVGEKKIEVAGGTRGEVETVSSKGGARRGQRLTSAVLEETGYWTLGNGGTHLATVLTDNVAKNTGTVLELTNAPIPGSGSVAETTLEAFRRRQLTDVLVDWRQPSHKVDFANDEQVRGALAEMYGQAPWQDQATLLAKARDPLTREADYRRFYFNELFRGHDQWLDPRPLVDTGERPARGEAVALGFDGSQYADATALWGCRLSDGLLFRVHLDERPLGPAGEGWRVDVDATDTAMQNAFDTWDVRLLLADPWGDWRPWIGEQWASRWPGRVQEFDTRHHTSMARELDAFAARLRTGQMTHDGAEALPRHIGNAVIRRRGDLILIAKERPDSARKIDAAMAAVLADAGRREAIRRDSSRAPDSDYRDYYGSGRRENAATAAAAPRRQGAAGRRGIAIL